jgi:hypothetical protein
MSGDKYDGGSIKYDVPSNRDDKLLWWDYTQTELPFIPKSGELQSLEGGYICGEQKVAKSFSSISPVLWGKFLVVSDSVLWRKLPDGWSSSQERFESYARVYA